MTLLGIDYGHKRIGIAVAERDIAFPRKVLSNSNTIFGDIQEIITLEKIETIIMGDTRSFGGHSNTISHEAESFAERLRETSSLPVILTWEAGSTLEAGRYATPDNQHNDSAAAAIILQRYIDMHSDVPATLDAVE